MNKGLYAFAKNDDVFVVICKSEYPNEWQALRDLDGCAMESGDYFYIMGTDARAELSETPSGSKILVFKSNDTVYFECPVSDELLTVLVSQGEDDNNGFCLIQSESFINKDEAYQMFTDGDIEGVICAFYTEQSKRKIFNLDEKGNIIDLK